jgi:hypothetical protein
LKWIYLFFRDEIVISLTINFKDHYIFQCYAGFGEGKKVSLKGGTTPVCIEKVSEKGGGIEGWKGEMGEERNEKKNKEGFGNGSKDVYLEWMNLMGWEEKSSEL